MTNPPPNDRSTCSNALIRFSGYSLLLSSIVKFWHLPRAMAYMASMGYVGSTVLVVAGLEFFTAILFLLPFTRRLGLLFVSGYLGGAIAAHLSIHRVVAGGPFLVFMATHRYIGALEPTIVLLPAWLGMWLSHRTQAARSAPEARTSLPRLDIRNPTSDFQRA